MTVLTWYPITPSSSVGETLTDYLEKYRVKDGKPTFAVVQAEDELAALGMALGAGWAGARSMTCTSGPGISLMSEFVGSCLFRRDSRRHLRRQRVGPSTGLPTRTAQADLLSVYQLSHGDTKHIVLLPGSAEECYSLAVQAFDLSERFQTPVFVLSDLDLGMNNWMADPFVYPDKPLDRGKVLTADELTAAGKFERYRDVDGDGIPYRTLPGTNHPLAGYFTRGTGHNEAAGYTEKPADYIKLMDRLNRKYDTAKALVPRPLLYPAERPARFGAIFYGSTSPSMQEALDVLAGRSIHVNALRVRGFPFQEEIADFVSSHPWVFVVEQNRDAQLKTLLVNEAKVNPTRLISSMHYDGTPITARYIVDQISQHASARTIVPLKGGARAGYGADSGVSNTA